MHIILILIFVIGGGAIFIYALGMALGLTAVIGITYYRLALLIFKYKCDIPKWWAKEINGEAVIYEKKARIVWPTESKPEKRSAESQDE